MPIKYTDVTGKVLVASIAPGITPAQAAFAMGLTEWKEITETEAAELQKPSVEEIAEATKVQFTNAIQVYLDSFAQTRNYDNILSACTYATSNILAFKNEGQYCVNARDAVWAMAYDIMNCVLAGQRPVPTEAELFAELPTLAWPVLVWPDETMEEV